MSSFNCPQYVSYLSVYCDDRVNAWSRRSLCPIHKHWCSKPVSSSRWWISVLKKKINDGWGIRIHIHSCPFSVLLAGSRRLFSVEEGSSVFKRAALTITIHHMTALYFSVVFTSQLNLIRVYVSAQSDHSLLWTTAVAYKYLTASFQHILFTVLLQLAVKSTDISDSSIYFNTAAQSSLQSPNNSRLSPMVNPLIEL